jgi:hypothetical protein
VTASLHDFRLSFASHNVFYETQVADMGKLTADLTRLL